MTAFIAPPGIDECETVDLVPKRASKNVLVHVKYCTPG